jgi:hypothetical protein
VRGGKCPTPTFIPKPPISIIIQNPIEDNHLPF